LIGKGLGEDDFGAARSAGIRAEQGVSYSSYSLARCDAIRKLYPQVPLPEVTANEAL
jgi:hypothetical protein